MGACSLLKAFGEWKNSPEKFHVVPESAYVLFDPEFKVTCGTDISSAVFLAAKHVCVPHCITSNGKLYFCEDGLPYEALAKYGGSDGARTRNLCRDRAAL